jgi:hypothetical protein
MSTNIIKNENNNKIINQKFLPNTNITNSNLTNTVQTNSNNLETYKNNLYPQKKTINNLNSIFNNNTNTKSSIKSFDKKMTFSSNSDNSSSNLNQISNLNQLPRISNCSKSQINENQKEDNINNDNKNKKISTKSKSFNVIEIKNLKNIRKENSTMNNKLISISYKNLDLKKIVEKEKFAEMQKFHFLEKFFDGNNLQYDQEKIFYNDPFESLDEELIKYRNKFILRSGKLLMENKMHFSGDDSNRKNKYHYRNYNLDNMYHINKNIKLILMEKDIEYRERILKENNHNYKNNPNLILGDNKNNIYEYINKNSIPNNNNEYIKRKDTEIVNTSYRRMDKSTADDLYDNKNNIYINKDFDIKFTENNNNNKNLINVIDNMDYNDNYDFNNNININTNTNPNYRFYNISKSSFKNCNDNNINDDSQLHFFDVKTESNKKINSLNTENNYNNNIILKTTPNAKNDKIKDFKINLINNNNNSNNISKYNNFIKKAKKTEEFFQTTTSQQFFDEEKIQNLDDSGILKPAKYENVYFKSMKYLQEKQEFSNPNSGNNNNNGNGSQITTSGKERNKNDIICLKDVEPNNKTKLEVEKIKNGIKDIMRRRFDFSDEYLNDVHRRLQKKKIDFDPEYENVKNKYEQYKTERIIAKKDFDTATKLRLLNRNPILQVNNLVAFPNIVSDPMLLANLYNVNMYNLEFSNKKILYK